MELLSMEIDRYQVPIRDRQGQIGSGEVACSETDDGFRVVLSCNGASFDAEAEDVFEAFALIRTMLDREGSAALCYGSSRNVFPSGMARSMGGGLKAYRLTVGKQALQKDLVGIFDTGPDIEVVSPEEQKVFFDAWLGSWNR
jgi:hypothetical protein